MLHPVYRHVCNNIRDIARTAYSLTITKEIRVVVVALSDEDVPVIKACWE